MRLLSISLLIVVVAAFATLNRADAATVAHNPASAHVAAVDVDDNDDTRVEVQLVVLGIAAFTVVPVGLAAYLLRKRLGLVAGPPEQDAGHH